MDSEEDITRLLMRACEGGEGAHDALFRRLHRELHAMADQHMRDERRDHTLQPTAIIHEAWIRLFGGGARDGGGLQPFEGRRHFLRSASSAMRHVLIDHARRRLADRRGAGARREAIEADALEQTAPRFAELLAVHEALEKLEADDPERAAVVQLRYFGGLDMEEIAAVLGVSERTVKRRWAFARAWLFREMGADDA